MIKHLACVWAVVGLLACVGCVGQGRVDDCEQLLRRTKEQVVDLQARLESKQNEIDALQNRPATDKPDTLAQLEAARADIERLRALLSDAQAKIRELASISGSALPAELDRALMALASTNPDLMSYDADRGMVKFSSDFTFALGKAEISATAQRSLRSLAEILKSDAASNYEVVIVGHTDNVPVTNPATLRNHKTNWHLSVHRAIAVKDVLSAQGIANVRMQVAGYGEHRPIVPNEVKSNGRPAGAEANRRVEIYLRPLAYSGTRQAATDATDATDAGGGDAGAVEEDGSDVVPVPADKGGGPGLQK